MKTNSLLTYLLYALLVALISVACYKACQMKKEKAEKAQEEAELQKTLRDMGYSSDTTNTSTYTTSGDSSTHYTTPAPDANGIVDAPTNTTKTTKPATTTTKAVTATKTTPAPTTPAPTATLKTTSGNTLTAKSGVSKVKGPGTGKFSVRAGTFSSKERAREPLEKVIKMDYQTATLIPSPTQKGYWTVLIMRTNDRAKATKLVDQMVARGVDAALF